MKGNELRCEPRYPVRMLVLIMLLCPCRQERQKKQSKDAKGKLGLCNPIPLEGYEASTEIFVRHYVIRILGSGRTCSACPPHAASRYELRRAMNEWKLA